MNKETAAKSLIVELPAAGVLARKPNRPTVIEVTRVMFLLLLFATFAVALGVSFAVMWLFTKPVDSVLRRIIADEISAAWSKYMKFAILVVGVSSGVPVHDLERYVSATLGGREVQSAASLGFDRWIFELYRAGIEALQGIAWMLLVFFVFALIAYVIVRIGEGRGEAKTMSEPSASAN